MAQYKHPDEEDKRSNEVELLDGLLNSAVDTAVAAPLTVLRTGHDIGRGLLSLLGGGVSKLTGGSFKEGLLRGSERYKTPDWMRTKESDAAMEHVNKAFEWADKPYQMFGKGAGTAASMVGASPGTSEWINQMAYWTSSLLGPGGAASVIRSIKVPTKELASHLKIYRDGWYANKAGQFGQIGAVMPLEALGSKLTQAMSPYYMALAEKGFTPSAASSIARATNNIEKTGKVSSKDARIIYNEVANQFGQALASGEPIPRELAAAARLVFPERTKVSVGADGSIPNMADALSITGLKVSDEIADLITPVMRKEYDLSPGVQVNMLNKVESTASTGGMMGGALSRTGISKSVNLDGSNPNYAWTDELINPDWPSYKTKGSNASHKAKLQESTFHAMEAAWDSLMTKRSKWGRYGQYGRGYRFTADDFINEIKNVNQKIADDYTADLAKWKEAGGAYNRKGVKRPKEPEFFVTPSKGDGATEIADNVKNVKNADGSYTSSGHVRFGSMAKTGDYLSGTVRQTHILNPETGRMANFAHDQLDLGSGIEPLESAIRKRMPGGRVVSLTGGHMSFDLDILAKHNLYSKKSKGDPESYDFHHEELERLGEGVAPGKRKSGGIIPDKDINTMLLMLYPAQQVSAKPQHYLRAADRTLGPGVRTQAQIEKEKEQQRKNNRMRN